MPKVNISETHFRLIAERAKREQKKFDAMINELLSKILWNEPSLLFRGKHYIVAPDLFGENIPKPNEIEE
jgi:hypothetical protein